METREGAETIEIYSRLRIRLGIAATNWSFFLSFYSWILSLALSFLPVIFNSTEEKRQTVEVFTDLL